MIYIFNEYFANVGPKLAEKILPSSLTFESFLDDQSNCESFFLLILSRMKLNKNY